MANQLFNRLHQATTRFHTNQDGVTSVEYAIMLALIVGVCITALNAVGFETASFWGGNSQAVGEAFDQAGI